MSQLYICHRGRRYFAVFAVGVSLLLPSVASAELSDFSLQFASNTSGAMTATHLYIVYRNPGDPNGKPPPIRHLVITAPKGTRIDLAIPRCTASDQQIMANGPSACPPDSQVGQGTLTAITGFGPPIDPYLTDVTIFNTGEGIVEIARDHNTGATITDDRIQIQGNVLTGDPPAFPGGPPDFQTAVRTIDFIFPATTHYFTTPPTCTTGEWTSQANFSFVDGTTQHLLNTTPCTVPKAAPQKKQHRPKNRKKHRGTKKRHGHSGSTHPSNTGDDPDHDRDSD